MRTLLTKGQKWVMTPSTMPMALLNFLGSLFRIVIIYYFLVVVGFLAASYYPLLKQKFLSHATADKKEGIRPVSLHFTTNPLCSTRIDPSESLPPVCPPTLEVYGSKGVRVLDYRWEGEEDSLTIVSRLI